MEKTDHLKPGMVVQLSLDTSFPCCFMQVTEPKPWGAQGFVAMPLNLGEAPGQAYYRANWEQMEMVGMATCVSGVDPEDCQ